MKKIEDFVFTVTNILSSARKFEQMQFFYQLLEIDMWNTYGILFSVEQMTFFCRADDIFENSVEQSRFEQMHFEQLTLTHFFVLGKTTVFFVIFECFANKLFEESVISSEQS